MTRDASLCEEKKNDDRIELLAAKTKRSNHLYGEMLLVFFCYLLKFVREYEC